MACNDDDDDNDDSPWEQAMVFPAFSRVTGT